MKDSSKDFPDPGRMITLEEYVNFRILSSRVSQFIFFASLRAAFASRVVKVATRRYKRYTRRHVVMEICSRVTNQAELNRFIKMANDYPKDHAIHSAVKIAKLNLTQKANS